MFNLYYTHFSAVSTLFKNKRFVLNLMMQRNASIFLEYKKKLISFFLYSNFMLLYFHPNQFPFLIQKQNRIFIIGEQHKLKKILRELLYSKSMAKFEAFLQSIMLSIKLIFLKCVQTLLQNPILANCSISMFTYSLLSCFRF